MRHISGALFAVFLLAGGAAEAGGALSVPLGGQKIVDFGQKVSTFYIKDPAIVDAKALDTHRVQLTGLSRGASPVIAYDASGKRVYEKSVRVGHVARARRAGSTVVVQNGKIRTSYLCSEARCRAYSRQP